MRTIALSALILGAILTVASCKKEDKGNANVMFIHASPDGPAFDVVQGDYIITGVAYSGNSGYVNLKLENLNFDINKLGTDTNLLTISNPTWEKDKFYSVIFVDSSYKIDKVLMSDNFSTPATGKSLIRFINASPNAGALDFFVQGDTVPLFENRAFVGTDFVTGVSPFTEVNAGLYNFELRQSDSTFAASNATNINLQSGKVYTLMAKGFYTAAGAQGLGVEVINNQ